MDRGDWWANFSIKTGNWVASLSSWRYGTSSSSKSLSRGFTTLNEAAFVACLAWHWVDRHWQCNWRVAWASLDVCAVKRRTSSNYCRNIQPYDKKGFSFCQSDTIFRLFFVCKLPESRTTNFRKVVRQHTEGMVRNILYGFCCKSSSVSSSERILKIR